MIEKANLVACACSIVMGAGGAVNFANGCSVVRTSAGLYRVTVDPQQQVALSAAVPVAREVLAAGVACSTSVAPPTIVGGASTYDITTAATLGGAAADVVGSMTFILYAIGVPGAGGI